jgi:hypothetical protein
MSPPTGDGEEDKDAEEDKEVFIARGFDWLKPDKPGSFGGCGITDGEGGSISAPNAISGGNGDSFRKSFNPIPGRDDDSVSALDFETWVGCCERGAGGRGAMELTFSMTATDACRFREGFRTRDAPELEAPLSEACELWEAATEFPGNANLGCNSCVPLVGRAGAMGVS